MDSKLVDHFVTLLLRLPLGLVFLFAGINKVSDPAKFAEGIHKGFDTTFLAGPLLEAFIVGLPWLEVLIGGLVLVGLLTRPALVAAGLLLAVLIFGLSVSGNYQAVAQNTIYIFVAAFALRTTESNMFSVDYLIGKRLANA